MLKNDADTIVTTLRELAKGAARLLDQTSAKVPWPDREVYAFSNNHLRVAKKGGVEVRADADKRMLVLTLNSLGCPHRFTVEVKLEGDDHRVLYAGATRVCDQKGWIYALNKDGKWYRLSPHFRRAFRAEEPCPEAQVSDGIRNAVAEAMQPGGALSDSVISSLIDLFCPLVDREKVRPGRGSREEAAA